LQWGNIKLLPSVPPIPKLLEGMSENVKSKDVTISMQSKCGSKLEAGKLLIMNLYRKMISEAI
jgi:hypothetical protein